MENTIARKTTARTNIMITSVIVTPVYTRNREFSTLYFKKIFSGFLAASLILSVLFCGEANGKENSGWTENERGVKYLKSGRYKEAIEALKAARRYLPTNESILRNLMAAYNNYGFELMKNGQMQEAIDEFQTALYYDSTSPYTYYNLGQAYYQNQQLDKAKEALIKANQMSPDMKGIKDLLERVKTEMTKEKRYQKIETEHFVMAFDTDVDEGQISYIRTYLEEAYGRIGTFLDYYPETKAVVLLHSEAAYDAAVSDKPDWAIAAFDGKIRIPVNKFKGATEDVVKIIYHEYAHVVVRCIIGDKLVGSWLSEGIASKAEENAGVKDMNLVRKYIERFGFVHIKDLPEDFNKISNPNKAVEMYMEAYLIVDYIIYTYGENSLKDILYAIKDGDDIPSAIEKVTGKTVESLEQDCKEYIEDKYAIKTDAS
ncbi:MAG: tetratricopeptide repeat protein [Candidatus Omnitrophica bacterium]|nr:tetratricopeptide repeat protein [Candidatus Omnitrophota bacterium]